MWPYTKWMEELYLLIKPTDLYYAHWLCFRRGLIMRSFGAVCIATLSFCTSFGVAIWLLPVEYAWYVAASIGIASGVFAYNWYGLRCPRCRRWFYDLIGERLASAQERCCHCGLQLYAPHGDL